ncbi:MAG: hypothetical protein EPO68_07645 [Planctomycetota bacterium]|nr:MAG: hypothetical protein EPO68_07645 [Planctomycetota bacterium]
MPRASPCRRLSLSLALAGVAHATDFYVAPGASLQLAIDAAQNGDRVLAQPCTYVETIDFHGRAIELIGLGGATATRIVAPAPGTSLVRFHSGEGAASVLQGFALLNASSPDGYGGAISCLASAAAPIAAPTIRDCVLRQCSARYGGGAAGAGAGLYAEASGVVLERCSLLGNLADQPLGQGSGCLHGPIRLRHSIAWGNSAPQFGGTPAPSADLGGFQALRVLAGDVHTGQLYLVLGSLSGMAPGIPVGAWTVALAFDAYTSFTLGSPNHAPLSASLGVLGPDGRAETLLSIPPGLVGALAGTTAHHAAVVIDLAGPAVVFATNAEPLALLP